MTCPFCKYPRVQMSTGAFSFFSKDPNDIPKILTLPFTGWPGTRSVKGWGMS